MASIEPQALLRQAGCANGCASFQTSENVRHGSSGLIALAFECNDHLPQLTALAKRYGDRRPDLADLCLIRMSELHFRHSVITVDRANFRLYRRNKRDAIPLICPPER